MDASNPPPGSMRSCLKENAAAVVQSCCCLHRTDQTHHPLRLHRYRDKMPRKDQLTASSNRDSGGRSSYHLGTLLRRPDLLKHVSRV